MFRLGREFDANECESDTDGWVVQEGCRGFGQNQEWLQHGNRAYLLRPIGFVMDIFCLACLITANVFTSRSNHNVSPHRK